MKLEQGTVWTQQADKVGGSYVLILTPEIREYLGLDKDADGNIEILVKADRGRWGPFLGIGLDRRKKH